MNQLFKKLITCTLICLYVYSGACIANAEVEGIHVFKKNFHLDKKTTRQLIEHISNYQSADNIWSALKSEFSLPHYEDNPKVQEQVQWLVKNKGFIYKAAEQAQPYLYYISQQVKKRQLPAELVLLPMIESAYNPFVYSSVGAGGIWQMMPDTATGYGVKQNWWYDGRRDVISSTNAALDYLVYLGSFFDGNWLLAIGAYNTGEGNVLSAIRRNVRDGKKTDFWSLPVARQTRDYVPRLLALAVVISNPEKYNIKFPASNNAPYLAKIKIDSQIDLKGAAILAGLSLKELKKLNPGYKQTATDPSGPHRLILPIQNVRQFSENYMRQTPNGKSLKWAPYTVRKGDSLYAIAKRYNTSIASLKKINSLTTATIKPGLKLLIPGENKSITTTIKQAEKTYARASSKPVKKRNNTMPKHYKLHHGDTLYMVRNGDNLGKIAQKYNLSVKTLVAANNVKNTNKLKIGTKLIIPTHLNAKHKNLSSPVDTIYLVKKGDSLDRIARKFHTTTPSIRVANLMTNNKIKAGEELVIPAKG